MPLAACLQVADTPILQLFGLVAIFSHTVFVLINKTEENVWRKCTQGMFQTNDLLVLK
jgi:hypothetical protein